MSDGAGAAGGLQGPTTHERVGVARAAAPPRTPARPSLVTEVTGEITPGSAPVWEPGSYAEWESRARLTTFLAVWEAQVTDERALRRTYARWIFLLITLQIVAAIAIVVAGGLGWLHVDVTVAQVLIPSAVADVLGLGYLVTKFLFSLPVRHSLDVLAHGASHGTPLAPPPGWPPHGAARGGRTDRPPR